MLSLHLNSVYPLFILSSLEIPEEPPQGCLSIASEERRERFPEAMIVVLLSRLCCLPWHHYHLWKQRYSKHSVRLMLCCRCSLHSFARYTHFVMLLSFWPLRVDCRIIAYQFSNGGHSWSTKPRRKISLARMSLLLLIPDLHVRCLTSSCNLSGILSTLFPWKL